MTPETTTQNDFPRRFAEALGWEWLRLSVEPHHIHMWIDEHGNAHDTDWLITWPAVEYLVERARAEGYWRRKVSYFPTGVVEVELIVGVTVLITGAAKSEPEATAYAVAKMLKVKLPEGVE